MPDAMDQAPEHALSIGDALSLNMCLGDLPYPTGRPCRSPAGHCIRRQAAPVNRSFGDAWMDEVPSEGCPANLRFVHRVRVEAAIS
jgi:hypothetical protein